MNEPDIDPKAPYALFHIVNADLEYFHTSSQVHSSLFVHLQQ